jgi:hypothetical protein
MWNIKLFIAWLKYKSIRHLIILRKWMMIWLVIEWYYKIGDNMIGY